MVAGFLGDLPEPWVYGESSDNRVNTSTITGTVSYADLGRRRSRGRLTQIEGSTPHPFLPYDEVTFLDGLGRRHRLVLPEGLGFAERRHECDKARRMIDTMMDDNHLKALTEQVRAIRGPEKREPLWKRFMGLSHKGLFVAQWGW